MNGMMRRIGATSASVASGRRPNIRYLPRLGPELSSGCGRGAPHVPQVDAQAARLGLQAEARRLVERHVLGPVRLQVGEDAVRVGARGQRADQGATQSAA